MAPTIGLARIEAVSPRVRRAEVLVTEDTPLFDGVWKRARAIRSG